MEEDDRNICADIFKKASSTEESKANIDDTEFSDWNKESKEKINKKNLKKRIMKYVVLGMIILYLIYVTIPMCFYKTPIFLIDTYSKGWTEEHLVSYIYITGEVDIYKANMDNDNLLEISKYSEVVEQDKVNSIGLAMAYVLAPLSTDAVTNQTQGSYSTVYTYRYGELYELHTIGNSALNLYQKIYWDGYNKKDYVGGKNE